MGQRRTCSAPVNVVLYSAIYGDRYDTVKPVHGAGASHAVLFTDSADVAAQAAVQGWDEVVIDPLDRLPNPMLRAKWWKTRPEIAVPEADISLWIDGSLTPYPGYAERCVNALAGVDLALTPHPWRDCIYDELAASLTLPKYDDDAMTAQVDEYRRRGHPAHWGLFASGAIARRHTGETAKFNLLWWKENLDQSWQDQLSLPVAVRWSGVSWAASMPWDLWWGYTDHGVGT